MRLEVGRLEDSRALRFILRFRYVIVTGAAFGFMLNHLRGTGIDWRYFVEGSELIIGQHRPSTPYPGGLHFYANYPDFQIGPLSLIVAAPIRIIGGDYSRELGAVVMTAVAPVLVYLLERASRVLHPPASERDDLLRSFTVLLGGLLVVEAWAPLSTVYAHLDDVLTLTTIVAAVWLTTRGKPRLQGLAVAAAIAAKPWGVLVIPLVFVWKGRDRVHAAAIALCGALLAWAPFVVADRSTLDATEPQNRVVPGSVLHLLGVAVEDAPTWVRALQLSAAVVVGLIAVLRGRWVALPLAGIAVRVALDSQIFLYYGTGLVLAALGWDLLRERATLPIGTLFAFVFLNDAYILFGDPTVRAAMRLALTSALVLFALFGPTDVLTRRFLKGETAFVPRRAGPA